MYITTESSDTARLLKKVIQTGKYKKGGFMCISVYDYLHHSDTQSDDADVVIKFMDELRQLLSVLGGDKVILPHHTTLTGALSMHFEEVFLTTVDVETLIQLAFRIYSDWDNRYRIINHFNPFQ